MRNELLLQISTIKPIDEKEKQTIQEVLQWIESGVDLCRLEKPATPNKHLVSYFVVVDYPYLLLVDHINAGLWLPTGGHVEPGEHPKQTVIREAKEELGIDSNFLSNKPLFITSTTTVGRTAGHTDVSLWYVLKGNRNEQYKHDTTEFNSIKWFHNDELPHDRADPELKRFVQKYETSIAI